MASYRNISEGDTSFTKGRRTIMAKTRRVVFSFDERSLESLQKITEQGRFASMADTVRESLQISRALQTQAQQGFTEVIVRNPETDEERVLVIPTLQPGLSKTQE
jgi:Arc/MetJ-type ribon-helix-helix transcriptional regulator